MTDIKRISIGGIKFSEERVHYTISCAHGTEELIGDFLQHVHSKQVNLPFLCQHTSSHSCKTCFCVSEKDVASIAEIAASIHSELHFTTHHQVASVTVFPHKKELSFAAIIMGLMESLAIPVYSSCSSISALVFNVPSTDLQIIASALTDIFLLPENHSPFQQEFQLRQPRNEIVPEVR